MTNCIVQNCPYRDTIKCECVRYMTSGETFYSNNTNTPSSGYSSVDANDLAIKSLKAQGYVIMKSEDWEVVEKILKDEVHELEQGWTYEADDYFGRIITRLKRILDEVK